MLTLRTIPSAWGELMDDLHLLCPSAVMAGGCLRDLAFGFGPKDIDVFMDVAEWNPFSVPQSWAQRRCLVAAEYAMGMREDVVGVYEYDVPFLGMPVQIVLMNRNPDKTFIHQVLDRIDFGACQVAYDGSSLYRTDACVLDHANYAFTLINCEDVTQARRSLRRAERFKERFPGALYQLEKAEALLDDEFRETYP